MTQRNRKRTARSPQRGPAGRSDTSSRATAPSPAAGSPWRIAFVAALVFACTFLAFRPALDGQFLEYDDDVNFTSNPHYRGLGLEQLRWMFTTFHVGHYHPLTWMTLGLDYELHGMNPRGYHLTNNLLHTLNALLVFLVALRLMTWSRGDDPRTATRWRALISAAVAALLFAVHPLRVESVAWITERRDLVSAALLLLCVLAYLRWHEPGQRRIGVWFAVCLGLFAMSLLGKVIGVTLPLVMLVLDWYPLRRFEAAGGFLVRRAWPIWIEKIPFLILALIFGSIAAYFDHERNWLVPLRDHPIPGRIAQALYGLVFYIWKTIAPFDLLPLYELRNPINPIESRFALAALLVGAATIALVLLRRRVPALVAAALCYAILLAPTLGLVQTGPQITADRYSYLSCIGWAIIAGAALLAWFARPSPAGRTPLIAQPRNAMAIAVVATLIITLGALTWRQCGVWRDTFTLWDHVISKTDRSAFAFVNRGVQQLKRNQIDPAAADFRSAIKADPGNAVAHFNLGLALETQHRDDEALAAFDRAAAINPALAEAHYNRGNVLLRHRQFEPAAEAYRAALAQRPDYAEAHTNLGNALSALGQMGQAEHHYRRAIELAPGLIPPRTGLARIMAGDGRRTEALQLVREALRIDPTHTGARELERLLIASPQ